MKMAAPEGAAIAWVQELSESRTLGEEDKPLASF
jgi:hypothetical protein